MPYSEVQLRQLMREKLLILGRINDVIRTLTTIRLTSETAQSYIQYGLARRLFTTKRCVQNIFSLIPPETNRPPHHDVRIDAAINLQAFLMSISAGMDNLAWTWVKEKNITKPNGNSLSRLQIGLGPSRTVVRESLPAELHAYLSELNDWFVHIKDLRDSLAHQIPAYIPPHCVRPEDEERYQEIEAAKHECLQRLDLEQHDTLQGQQNDLVHFQSWLVKTHDNQQHIYQLHPQVLTDAKTLCEISERMISLY